MGKSYKEIMPQITTFIFDVDGVLTDGGIIYSGKGNELKRFNAKDGQIIKPLKKFFYSKFNSIRKTKLSVYGDSKAL